MSPSLAPVLCEVEEQVKTAGRVSLFLDFDGTLVPVSADPAAAQLDPETRETLRRIARKETLTTTVISGRSIEDLYARVRLEGVIYAGNHGLEIFGRRLKFVEPAASAHRENLARLCEDLTAKLRPIPGALVEYKGLTASVHYRQAAQAAVPEIEAAVRAAVARAGAWFRVSSGRKVFDIVPRTGWHKGAAVRWINSHLENEAALSIYLGDDASDEDAFSVLPDAITIKVGGAPTTCARYRLPDPGAVHQFLQWLESHERPR